MRSWLTLIKCQDINKLRNYVRNGWQPQANTLILQLAYWNAKFVDGEPMYLKIYRIPHEWNLGSKIPHECLSELISHELYECEINSERHECGIFEPKFHECGILVPAHRVKYDRNEGKCIWKNVWKLAILLPNVSTEKPEYLENRNTDNFAFSGWKNL